MHNYLYGAESCLRSSQSLSNWRISIHLPPRRSPYSQEPYTGLNPEPDDPVHTIPSIFPKTNLILSSNFCVVLHKGLFPSEFSTHSKHGRNRKITHCQLSYPPLWSSRQSPGIQIQRSWFDSRRYQIFWEVVGLERSPLRLASAIEELLEKKLAAPV
jgi:hypothetical protein